MATPVKTLIINDLLDAIASISSGATYNRTVATVSRLTQPLSEVVTRGDTVSITSCRERKRFLNDAIREVTMTLTLLCDAAHQDDPGGALDMLLSDVEKAINVDVKRGGKAQRTDVVSTDDAVTEPARPIGSGLMEIEIVYRHMAGDPTTAA